MENKINKISHRINVIFVMILIIFTFQILFMVQSQQERTEIQNKINKIEIRLDSLNQEMIYLNQYLYD